MKLAMRMVADLSASHPVAASLRRVRVSDGNGRLTDDVNGNAVMNKPRPKAQSPANDLFLLQYQRRRALVDEAREREQMRLPTGAWNREYGLLFCNAGKRSGWTSRTEIRGA